MRNPLICLLLSFVAWTTDAQPANDSADPGELLRRSLDKRLPIKEAILTAHSAWTASQRAGNDSIVCLAQIQLGVLYWNDGQLDLALRHLESGQRLCEELGNDRLRAKCLHYRGLGVYYKCEFDRALVFYDSAEQLYTTLRDDSAVAKIKSHKGIIFNVQGNYDAAIDNMVSSFRLQEQMPGYRDMTVPLQFPSVAAGQLYYQSKLDKDLESLRFIEGGNDQEKLAFTLQNIGKDYHYLKKYRQAIPYLMRSDQVYRNMGQLPLTSSLAAAYEGLGNYDSAEYWYQSRLADMKAKGTQIHLAAVTSEHGGFCMKMHRWHDALAEYGRALKINQKLGLLRSVSSCQKSRALILEKLDNNRAALAEIDSGLAIARRIGCLADVVDMLEIRSRLLEKIGKYPEALAAVTESSALRDSINEGESQLQTARLQVEYDSEKKNRDLAALQAQNEIKQADLNNKNLLLLLGLVIIVLVVGLILFLFLRYKQKVRNARELEIKNQLIGEKNLLLTEQARQKEALLHEIHHRVKNNLQVISSLINLKSKQVSAETNQVLQQLGNRIFTMGLIHEKLYQTENLQVVRLDTYLIEVGEYLIKSFEETERPVRLDLDCEPVEIEVDKALTCGLICNELLTNSLKHAFPENQSGRAVTMALKRSDGLIEWRLGDNGTKANVAPETMRRSFGLRFVEQLVTTKLAGSLKLEMNGGFTANIDLPIK